MTINEGVSKQNLSEFPTMSDYTVDLFRSRHTALQSNETAQHAANILSSTLNSVHSTTVYAYNQVGELYERVNDLKNRYLTVDYITLKAKHAVKAQVLPLSNPPGWDEKMKKVKKRLALQFKVKLEIEQQIARLPHRTAKNKHYKQNLALLTSNHEKICAIIEKTLKEEEYLEKQRFSQISSRFAGYAGMASNALIPGSGILVKVAFTSAAAATQEQLLDILPEDLAHKSEEKRNVRLGTFSTAACTAASVAFSILVMPTVKEIAWHYLSGPTSQDHI